MTKEDVFELSQRGFGTVPGIVKEMAEHSIPLSYLYVNGVQIMKDSSFTDLEINAIELRISKLNNCESCQKGHSFLAKRAGLGEEDLHAILSGESTSSQRLNRLLKAAEYIYHSGADLFPDITLDYLEDEEISQTEVFEIIGLLSLKTISNYTNNYLSSIRKRAT